MQGTSAHTIEGVIKLADGKRVPEGTKLVVSRKSAWDSKTIKVDSDGTFAIRGLPTEQYRISGRAADYRLAAENWSLDVVNAGSLVGWVRGSIGDLVILLEPGKLDYSNRPDRDAIEQFMSRRKETIRGATNQK